MGYLKENYTLTDIPKVNAVPCKDSKTVVRSIIMGVGILLTVRLVPRL
jgi:hypothetical protein